MKKIIGLLFSLMLVISLTSCGQTSEPSEKGSSSKETNITSSTEEPIKLKFANTQPEEDIETKALYECKKRIEEESNGKIQIEVFPNSALGDTDDLVEQAIQGMPIVTPTDPARLQSNVNDFGILQMPYLMSVDDIDKVMNTNLYQTWDKSFQQQGIRVLTSNWYGGTRHFVLNKTIDQPSDLKGQKIRTMGNDICIESVNAMGATATPMSMTEVYPAIEQKGLDGVENQPTSTYSNMLFEVLTTTNKTGHFTLLGVPVMGEKVFQEIPSELQDLILKTFKDVGTEYQKIGVEEEEKVEKKMVKAGMQIHEVNVEVFKDATKHLYKQFGYEELREELYKEMGIK